MNSKDAMIRAQQNKKVIPAFNIPYLSMVKPIVQAIVDENSICMVQVARVEWEKFSAQSLEAVAEEYAKYANLDHTLLHLDHVPVIDEDFLKVDYMPILRRAIDAGFQSVMIDASRLDFDGNIAATAEAAALAHSAGIPIESELGSVMGHESGEMPPYDEIFKSKQGFTDLEQAKRFAKESGCDWMSVAVGSIHGAVAEGLKDQKKPEARLDVDHIKALRDATGMPLVLHGGSGINRDCIIEGIKNGITKVNVGTEVRQTYEQAMRDGSNDIEAAREAVYRRTRDLIDNFFDIKNTKDLF